MIKQSAILSVIQYRWYLKSIKWNAILFSMRSSFWISSNKNGSCR